LKKQLLIVSIIVVLILLFDQLLKVYVKSNFGAYETRPILGDWFVMEYIENQGMAFGTKFGSQVWHKLALSIFRIVAILAIGYYWFRQAKKGVRLEFLIAVGFILAGASGNLIDSMFYDSFFAYDPCLPFNELKGSGTISNCGFMGEVETRHTGFLMGNVVDMFKFQATWPSWVPWLGGDEVFPAIWNLADASITLGVIMVFLRQRKYFPKKKEESKNDSSEDSAEETSNSTDIEPELT
jgi:signal peptidase II